MWKMDTHTFKQIRHTFVLCVINVACTCAKEICSFHHHTYTYCEDGYYCCENNTKCCGSSLTPWELMGVVLAVLLGLCMCVFCAIFLTKKNKKPRRVIQPTDNVFPPISTITDRMNNRYRLFTLPDYSHLYPQQTYSNPSSSENRPNTPTANNTNTSGESSSSPQGDVPSLPSAPVLPPPPYSQEDPIPCSISPPPPYRETESV